jgi:hypothetical protein
MALNIITKEIVRDAAIPIIIKFLDIFRKDEEILIEWTSPDAVRITILWGAIKLEKGERKIFTVKGKPGFVQTVLRDLQKKGAYKILES